MLSLKNAAEGNTTWCNLISLRKQPWHQLNKNRVANICSHCASRRIWRRNYVNAEEWFGGICMCECTVSDNDLCFNPKEVIPKNKSVTKNELNPSGSASQSQSTSHMQFFYFFEQIIWLIRWSFSQEIPVNSYLKNVSQTTKYYPESSVTFSLLYFRIHSETFRDTSKDLLCIRKNYFLTCHNNEVTQITGDNWRAMGDWRGNRK